MEEQLNSVQVDGKEYEPGDILSTSGVELTLEAFENHNGVIYYASDANQPAGIEVRAYSTGSVEEAIGRLVTYING